MTVLSKMIGFVTTTDPGKAKAFYVRSVSQHAKR